MTPPEFQGSETFAAKDLLAGTRDAAFSPALLQRSRPWQRGKPQQSRS
jgi:hypothetical protein